jgi:uncharacterized protein YhbP (UPF0306 family)
MIAVVTEEPDLAGLARSIIDSNRYLTLGTADEDGVPWVSPVWYASADYREFFWVSSPDARHSRNVTARPEVSIVIFDSQVPVGGAQAVYMAASAEQLDADSLERGIEIFSRRSVADLAREWTAEDVRPPARHRLYRALATEQFVLGPRDERLPVRPA